MKTIISTVVFLLWLPKMSSSTPLDSVYVAVSETEIRETPNEVATVIVKAKFGEGFSVTRLKVGGWTEVYLPNSKTGWIQDVSLGPDNKGVSNTKQKKPKNGKQESATLKDTTYWVWKPSQKPLEHLADAVISISASIGKPQEGLEVVDEWWYGEKRERTLEFLKAFSLNEDETGVARGFRKWNIIPTKATDSIYVERGRISPSPDQKPLEAPLKIKPMTFPPYSDNKPGATRVFAHANVGGSPLGLFFPTIHVQGMDRNDGRTVVSMRGFPPVPVPKAQHDYDYLVFTGVFAVYSREEKQSYMQTSMGDHNAIIKGILRFPENEWTEVRNGLEIMGGGLRFDSEGISLLPGTAHRTK